MNFTFTLKIFKQKTIIDSTQLMLSESVINLSNGIHRTSLISSKRVDDNIAFYTLTFKDCEIPLSSFHFLNFLISQNGFDGGQIPIPTGIIQF